MSEHPAPHGHFTPGAPLPGPRAGVRPDPLGRCGAGLHRGRVDVVELGGCGPARGGAAADPRDRGLADPACGELNKAQQQKIVGEGLAVGVRSLGVEAVTSGRGAVTEFIEPYRTAGARERGRRPHGRPVRQRRGGSLWIRQAAASPGLGSLADGGA